MAPKTRSATRKAATKSTGKGKMPPTLDTTAIITWPQYKDDLPNAFNGEVDPQLDFISRVPPEILDRIASYLLLDHDPDRDIRTQEKSVTRPHALLSFAAMSRKMYYSTEAACERLLHTNGHKVPRRRAERKDQVSRRSSRIAARAHAMQPQRPVYRCELLSRFLSRCFACGCFAPQAVMANTVSACSDCAEAHLNPGGIINLTEALQKYDLRDYQLLKSRQPGPRAKTIDLPAIAYTATMKGWGYPIFSRVATYLFRHEDVKMVARLVHGDFGKHMEAKNAQKQERKSKARRDRIRKAMVAYYQDLLEISKSSAAKYYSKRLKHFQDDDWKEDDYFLFDGGESGIICFECGDVRGRPGLSRSECYECRDGYYDRRLDAYDARLRREREEAGVEGE